MKLKLCYRTRKMGKKFYIMGENRCFEINEVTKDILSLYANEKKEEEIIIEMSKIYEEIKEIEIKEMIDKLKEEGIIE